MHNLLRYLGQGVAFLLFALGIGVLSASPSYHYRSSDVTVVKLSLSHAADRVKPCVKLTPKEISELAPNMRQAERCERERLPVTVELEIDGKVLARIEALPSGLWRDGHASVYETFEVTPGTHSMTVRLRDSVRTEGWDYSHTQNVTYQPGQYFTVTFAEENGGFLFR